jgi:hypothetical protein
VKHLSRAPLFGRILALPTSIKSVLKGLPRTKHFSFLKTIKKITTVKRFVT